MKIGIKKIIPVLVMAATFIVFVSFAWADSKNLSNSNEILNQVAGTQGAGYVSSNTDINATIGTIIKTALSFLGVIFIMLIIYAGYLWMTARGEEAQITKAKDILTQSIIGLVIVVLAYTISGFVFSYFVIGKLQ